MAPEDRPGNAQRLLSAIREAREGFGAVHPTWDRLRTVGRIPTNPWMFHLADGDVLRILLAPELPVHRPGPFREAWLMSPEGEEEFSETEANIGFAGARICGLPRQLQGLGIRPASAPPVGDPALAKRLSRTLDALDALLHDSAVVATWGGWESTWNGMVPFDEYRKTTKAFGKFARFSADGISSATARKRELRSHPAGTRLERFIREHLASAFRDIYRTRTGRARASDNSVTPTPFLRFAATFFDAITHPVAEETIVRALSPSAGARRNR